MGRLSIRVPPGMRKTCMPQDSMCFWTSPFSLHRAVFSGASLKSTVPGRNLYRMQIKLLTLRKGFIFF